MVVEHWKSKEQRLLNEISNLKKEKEDLELIIKELKTNIEVNTKILDNSVNERNKIERDYTNLAIDFKKTIKNLDNKIEIINKLKNLTLLDRIFNYKKQFNNE